MITILVFVLTIFCVTCPQTVHSLRNSSQRCNTPACQQTAVEYKTIINPDVDPCTDFSGYVCGNFDKLFSIPPGETSFSIFSEIGAKITNTLRKLLEDKQHKRPHSSPQGKAVVFFQSCMDMAARNQQAAASTKNAVARVSAGPDYDSRSAALVRTGFTSRIFSVMATPDSHNPTYFILGLDVPGFILSSSILKKPKQIANVKKINAYKNFTGQVLDILGMGNKRAMIDSLVELHIKFAKATPSIEDQSNPKKFYNKFTIAQLQSRCSEINWMTFINGALNGSGHSFNASSSLLVYSKPYIDNICVILKEYKSDPTKSKVLEFDIEWAMINALVPYGSEKMIRAKEELSAVLYGVVGRKKLWKTCTDVTSNLLGTIVGNMYVKESFHASQKKDIERLVKQVKKAFHKQLKKLNWMDNATRGKALKKLSSMSYKIGYPDSILNETKLVQDFVKFKVDPKAFLDNTVAYQFLTFPKDLHNVGQKIPKDLWMMHPHTVNAYYNPLDNEIVFPASILQFPMYEIGLPISTKYAAIGAVIGHEILHGFDTLGSQYDSDGMLRDWWTKETRSAYKQKANCIIKQYGNYSIFNTKLKSTQTIGEDIADNAGMKMAFKAAMAQMKNREADMIEGLNYTPEQLFFLKYARVWCSIHTKESILSLIQDDVHTIGKYRINGPLSNMPEFSKAFKCDRTKPMNRLKKCSVF